MFISEEQQRLLAGNTTGASGTLIDNLFLYGTVAAVFELLPSVRYIKMLDPSRDWQSLELGFYGVGADNTTGSYTVWAAKPSSGGIDFMFHHLCTGVFTLSSASLTTTPGAALFGESDGIKYADVVHRIADQITVTDSAYATAMAAAYNIKKPSETVSSPANNTPARLFIPDVPGCDIVVQVVRGSSSPATAVNAFYQRLTKT